MACHIMYGNERARQWKDGGGSRGERWESDVRWYGLPIN